MNTKPIFRAYITGLVLRILLPWYAHGFRYMDEHWQVIEPANGLVHGLAKGTWSITTEWAEGLRSWFYPGFVSIFIRLAHSLGFTDGIWINAFVRSIHGVISAFAIILVANTVYAASNSANSDRKQVLANLAAWLTALWPFAIYCGFHTHGEMIGALFILGGCVVPLIFESDFQNHLISGALFGLALCFKIDLAVAGLGFGICTLLLKEFRNAIALAFGVLPFALTIGFLDHLMWGSWFHSVLGHAKVNLVDGVGNQWGVSPWWQHWIYFFDIIGFSFIFTVPLFVIYRKRVSRPLLKAIFTQLFFVAVFSTIPHKEKRFLAPLLYIGQATALICLSYIKDKVLHRRAVIVVSILLAIQAIPNAVTYIVKRPWWNRIEAIHNAGKIPGIEKLITPHWPALFYFPKYVVSEVTEADATSISRSLKGIKKFGLATEWTGLSIFENLGYKCKPTPEIPKNVRIQDPLPWAYDCTK